MRCQACQALTTKYHWTNNSSGIRFTQTLYTTAKSPVKCRALPGVAQNGIVFYMSIDISILFTANNRRSGERVVNVQRHFVWVVQWNSKIVIQEMDVKSDNCT